MVDHGDKLVIRATFEVSISLAKVGVDEGFALCRNCCSHLV
jgi:hypothetical protein